MKLKSVKKAVIQYVAIDGSLHSSTYKANTRTKKVIENGLHACYHNTLHTYTQHTNTHLYDFLYALTKNKALNKAFFKDVQEAKDKWLKDKAKQHPEYFK